MYHKVKNIEQQLLDQISINPQINWMKSVKQGIIAPLAFLKSEEDKGLCIQWNFSRIQTQNSFQAYHLFLMFGSTIQQARKLLQSFYQQCNLGDLIGIVKFDKKSPKIVNIQWQERTCFDLQQKFINQNHIQEIFDPNKFSAVIKKAQSLTGLVILNILQSQRFVLQNSINQLKKFIAEERKLNSRLDSIVINIISGQLEQSFIDSILGINHFRYKQNEFFKTTQEIINYAKILVFKKIEARIFIQNIQNFNLGSNSDWKITDACFLQKKYYNVPCCKFTQCIAFFLRDSNLQLLIDLTLHLSISLFDGNQIKAKKNFSFIANSVVHKSKTSIPKIFVEFGVLKLPNKQVVLTNLTKRQTNVWMYQSSDR